MHWRKDKKDSSGGSRCYSRFGVGLLGRYDYICGQERETPG